MTTSNDLEAAGVALQRAAVELDAAGQALVSAAGGSPIPPPAGGHEIILGTSVHRPPLSRTDAFREAQSVYEGRVRRWVTYENPAPTWPDCRAPNNVPAFVEGSWHSIKPAGSLAQCRAQITAHMESIPAELRPDVVLTVWHEPEGKIRDGVFTLSDWIAYQEHTATEGARLGILTAANLMEWTWQEASGRNPEDYRPGVIPHELASIDGYDKPGTRSYTEVFGKIWDTYASWGCERFGIREMGSHDPDPEGWWTDAVQGAYEDGVELFCPWDSPLDNDYAISDATRVVIADAVDAVNA